MRLNRIQSLYLFKETSPKAPRQSNQHPTPTKESPHALSSSPFLLSPLLLGTSHTSSLVGRPTSPPRPRPLGIPPCWFLVLDSSTSKGRKAREEEKKKIKKRDQELIAIQTSFKFSGLNFLRDENSTLRGLFQTDLEWISIKIGYLCN